MYRLHYWQLPQEITLDPRPLHEITSDGEAKDSIEEMVDLARASVDINPHESRPTLYRGVINGVGIVAGDRSNADHLFKAYLTELSKRKLHAK